MIRKNKIETTDKEKQFWLHTFLTPQVIGSILLFFIGCVVFWQKTSDNWTQTKEVSTQVALKADKSDVRAIDEKFTRQSSENKKDIELLKAAIEDVADWKHYEQGRQAGYKQRMDEEKK